MASMLSQEGETFPIEYLIIHGCNGAPARKAPVLKGNSCLPLVVVPCKKPFQYIAAADLAQMQVDKLLTVEYEERLQEYTPAEPEKRTEIYCMMRFIAATSGNMGSRNDTSGNRSTGRRPSPAATLSMRSLT